MLWEIEWNFFVFFLEKRKQNFHEKTPNYFALFQKLTLALIMRVFSQVLSAETIFFWIWPYLLWPLVTVHKSAETIQGRKLFAEIRYFRSQILNILNHANKLNTYFQNEHTDLATLNSKTESLLFSLYLVHKCNTIERIDYSLNPRGL